MVAYSAVLIFDAIAALPGSERAAGIGSGGREWKRKGEDCREDLSRKRKKEREREREQMKIPNCQQKM